MSKYHEALEKAFGIKGKVIIVAGGTGAIGGEVCEGLALQGARIALLGTSWPRANAKAMELRGLTGGELEGYACEITDMASVRACFAQIREEMGPIAALINAAGVTHEKFLSEMDVEDWQKVMDVSARGTFVLNKCVGEIMEKDGGGRIINISSLAASHGKPQFTAYTPAKCAQDGFSWTLAAEWGRKNITVNSVWPVGAMFSRMNMYKTSPAFLAYVKANYRRTFYPRELSGMMAFLISDAGSYINGQIIDCQGGYYHTDTSDEFSPEDPLAIGHGVSERKG